MALEVSDYANIEQLIHLFPSNYAEMHEAQPYWKELKEKIPQVLHYIHLLQNNQEPDISSLTLLANLAHNAGVFSTHVLENYPQGVQLLSLALQTKQEIGLGASESIALTHTQLADCSYRNGNYSLAIRHFQLADQIYKQNGGNRKCDLERAFVLHACGNAYYIIGAYTMALALLTEARILRSQYLAENDIEFGYLEHDHADVLRALGFYDKADDLFTSALKKKKNFFQTDTHTNVALLYQCRGLLYIKNNQLERAKENLELAFDIYRKHTEEFAIEYMPDLFRNYFYSILLQLAAGNLEQAEQEINNFEVLQQSVEDKSQSLFLRLSHGKIRLYHQQNNLDRSFKQLQDTIKTFIPDLKIASADKFLNNDNKVNIASLLSQYGIEYFIQNNYQNLEECLEILTTALQFKKDFYQSLPQTPIALGNYNYALSDYDFGLLYYLSALACENKQQKEEMIRSSADYFQQAKIKFIHEGVNENHVNITACTIQLGKIKELKESMASLQKRISFFQLSSNPVMNLDNESLPCLDTIIRDYP